MEPTNPENWHALTKQYAEKVRTDARLPKAVAKEYLLKGLDCDEKALAINPDYFDALTLRAFLLRRRAALYEPDAAMQRKLIAQAEICEQRALAVRGKKEP